jgi:hypothetical protein
MSDDTAYGILLADAKRRYDRWFLALQCWTLSLIPMSWLVFPPKPVSLWWVFVWFLGVRLLQKRWRKSYERIRALQNARLEQLVAECEALARRERW